MFFDEQGEGKQKPEGGRNQKLEWESEGIRGGPGASQQPCGGLLVVQVDSLSCVRARQKCAAPEVIRLETSLEKVFWS